MWSKPKAVTCRSINKQIKYVVQEVGVNFYMCNVVSRKMYNIKFA